MSRLRRKLFACLIATALFGLAFGTMYILWARFEPTFFYAALGGYVLLLVLALLLVGRKPKDLDAEIERDLEESTAEAGQMSADTGVGRAPVAQIDTLDGLPIQVEKATGMRPSAAPGTPEGGPAGYTLRGFTLFERDTKTGRQRVFARGKPVGGGRPIPLPEGHRARWDNKKKRPFLDQLPPPAPATEPEPEEIIVSRPTAKMPTGITARGAPAPAAEDDAAVRTRPCAAFTSPGIMCARPAKGESPYCGLHASYKPHSLTEGFEVHHDSAAAAHKPFRGGMGDFEVRVAKPQAKAVRFRAPTVEVQTARPSTHPAPAPGGRQPKPARPPRTSKPFKGLMDRPFTVRVGKPVAKPLRVTGPGALRAKVAKPAPPKPLRLSPPAPVEVRTARPNARPIKMRPGREPMVRSGASLADAKPLRPRAQDDFDVATARGSLMAPSNRTLRCKATLANGKRCSNDARGGAVYCRQHKNFKPRIEAVVVRDTRARSSSGVGDLDRPTRRKKG